MRILKMLSIDRRLSIFRQVQDGAILCYRYLILTALSTIIASFGLLANSTAAVIGAMIIAPLMGPILGVSLGLVLGSSQLQRRSLLASAAGVLSCLLIAYLIGLLPFTLGISQEMLARSVPTTFDIAIALAAGLAAAYGSVNSKVSAALAGVAIAVALVPPLAASGLLFALGAPRLGLGAFILWLANFLSIQLAASVVYMMYGFLRQDDAVGQSRWRFALRFLPSIVALALVGWFLTNTLMSLFENHTVRRKVSHILSEQIGKRTGGQLDEILNLQNERGQWVIVASALSPQPFGSEQVGQIEKELQRQGIYGAKLILRSIVSQDVGSNGRVYLSPHELSKKREESKLILLLNTIRATLIEALSTHEGLELAEVERNQIGGDMVITALVRAPSPVEPSQVQQAQEAVRAAIGENIRLIVRSVITHDADDASFLFRQQERAEEPGFDALKARLSPIVAKRLASNATARLRSLSLAKDKGRIIVTATVEADAPTPIEVVKTLSDDLRKHVDPRLSLKVATELLVRAE